MDSNVKPATRLDAVVKLREKDEERARIELAEATRHAAAAERAASDARARAREDSRQRGMAAEWELTESAHFRALREAAQAERAAHAATQKLVVKRESWGSAYKKAESMRRVAETRRQELIAEAASKERKELDEVAILLHGRN
jgi:flagellar export protein FliJ